MWPLKMEAPRAGETRGAANSKKFGSFKTKLAMHGAALIKRLILAAAIRGSLPASWATWLLHSLRLRGA
jgi:hypothetical protein